MHNMAIAFHKKGYDVSGSDDEIFEPARNRLAKYGLLPNQNGWFPEKISPGMDAVILGMHARKDNPELIKAIKEGVKIYSFPEFIYESSRNKKRIVIAGSHGKTTITSMIMHVLAKLNFNFDYAVGSQVPGFEDSVRISESAPLIVIEGDEYLSSALDRRPKFLWYNPSIALISGIAWDHMNVFPTFEIYKKQFSDFISGMDLSSVLIWCRKDYDLRELVSKSKIINKKSYSIPWYRLHDGKFIVTTKSNNEFELNIFGSHNLLNMKGARMICGELGVYEDDFYASVRDFSGAGKRLEKIYSDNYLMVFRDFAHAPSKVKGTLEGLKTQFPGKKIYACLELHTYSSLNKDFLPQYRNSCDFADRFFLFLNEEAARLKDMQLPSTDDIKEAFNNREMLVFYHKELMEKELEKLDTKNSIILLMSSGSFDNWDFRRFIEKLKNKSTLKS